MTNLPPPDVNYEFTEAQNVEFRSAAYWMSIVGRLTILFGILACLAGFLSNFNLIYLAHGTLQIISGALVTLAANAFRKVSETTGRDIENVMEAVTKLKNLNRLQAILYLIGALLVIISVGLVVAVGVSVSR